MGQRLPRADRAVIGQEWLQAPDVSGARRSDDPSDIARLEVAMALERGIPMIPVLRCPVRLTFGLA